MPLMTLLGQLTKLEYRWQIRSEYCTILNSLKLITVLWFEENILFLRTTLKYLLVKKGP